MSGPGIPHLLREHARTFALTLRLLPRSLREPLSLAYLLARASDTVADAGSLSQERRIEMLQGLQDLLQEKKADSWKPTGLKKAFSPAEQELLDSVPELLKKLASLPDLEELLRLWQTIVEGQLFDLRRFTQAAGPLSRAELEHYCYLVAGCVGESWTRLIARHEPGVLTGGLSEMILLGCSYGKGLQLVNILRDRVADRGLGRIYASEEGIAELFDLAEGWLAEGEEYLLQLRSGRILYATALPHDLALMTLRGIRRCPEAGRVKVSRGSLYGLMARGLPSLWLPRCGNPAS